MLFLSIVVYITAYFGLLTATFFLLTYFGNRDKIKDPIPQKEDLKKISFIIPVFNEEIAIVDTLNSLLNITYPKDKYEIIVVDDGSTDKTYKIAKKFQDKYPNIKVYTKKNGGCSSALNFGISKAKGEIIARFDADTTLDKDAPLKMIGYFRNPKVMAVTSSLNVNNHKSLLEKIQWAEYLFGIFLRKIFDLNNAIHVIPGPLSMYKTEFFAKYGGFDEENITEDTEMAMRIQSHGFDIRNSISANVYTNTPNNFWVLLKQRIRWYTGFLHNSWDYKHLYHAKRKTDLSLFILPSSIISILLAFISFFVLLYYNLKTIKTEIIRTMVNGFEYDLLLKNLKLKDIIEFITNYATSQYIFFLILGLFLTILFLIIAKYHSGEKRRVFLTFVSFFIFYSFFFLLWWGCAIFDFLIGKKQKWGRCIYQRGRLIYREDK